MLFYIENLVRNIKRGVISIELFKNECTLNIDSSYLNIIIFYLKYHNNALYKVLIDITAIDYINKRKRFEVVYNLLSIKKNARIRLKVNIDEITFLTSIVEIHSCANWLEREVRDMFGIYFLNHPDLRRILTDYGFEGFPLRKDFPLIGFIEIRYDEEKKRIVYEPVETSQEMRIYNNKINPWNPFFNGNKEKVYE